MKLVSLMSNGIDSPVASYRMSLMGADVILLHMDNRPYTDDRSVENVKAIAMGYSLSMMRRVRFIPDGA